jgi:hypothetical protein
MARGGHAATARCRAGPASDRLGPLVSDFRNKKLPQRKIAQNKYLGIEKNSGKIHGGMKLNLEHFS